MAHTHEPDSGNTFKLGLILNTGFTIFEMAVGVITGSLALIADATHNLTDSLTLGIALIAERIGKRHADNRRSYGYGRAKIIASLLNAGILVAIATFIGFEAIQRLDEPKDVPGLTIAAVAAIGITINGSIAYLLSKQRHNLNARSAYTNMLYDTLSSVGALLAGFAIALFGWTWLDSAVGILIAVMLLYATFGIIKDALHILLEGVPSDIDLRLVKHNLLKLENVIGIDDIHAWTIDNDYYAFSCHLIVDEQKYKDSRQTVEVAKKLLADKYGFRHSTIEVELEDSTKHEEHERH
ncbi:cation transporter [Candidatus Saccharibacteria bacterium]|nr:cation transporter [Candidatus Saccharibacteria bacterium]